MFEFISKCKGCGCDLISIRATKGRLKHWCSPSCRSRWRRLNETSVRCKNTYQKQKRRGYLNKWRAIKLKGGKCQKCGESRAATLCFHHRDPGQKKIDLIGRTFATQKWDSIKEEVDKCDLLCHNCHFEVHFGDSWIEFFNRVGMRYPPG